MGPEVRVTVIAAGFDRWEERPEFGAEVPLPPSSPSRPADTPRSTPDVFATDDDADDDGDDDGGLDVPSFLR
jgi:cell division protein FtsZ